MLIDTPYKVGDNVSFKLASGEEIVGRLEEETDTHYALHKPMVLIAQQKGLGLAPFMFSVSPAGKFMLKANAVSCVAKTEDNISKQYTETTTGIALAKQISTSMPEVVRTNVDKHKGHASPTPNPFHQEAYTSGSPTVFTNNEQTVRIGDTTACGDPAAAGSPTVFANNIKVHRKNDATDGHGSWVANAAESGSPNVWANEGYVPPIIISPAAAAAINAVIQEAISNPPDVGATGGAQSNGTIAENQVPQRYEGAPAAGVDDLGTTTPLVDASAANSTAAANGIPGFLTQLLDEAATNAWDETVNPSNGNIIGIWKELGFPDTSYWKTDQTPWCAGFCNWVLKRTGYKYMQSARAYDFRDKTSVYGGVPVPLSDGQPGDIVVWNYSHVNFIYTVPSPGVYTFVGGNQSDKASAANNNPSGGSITNSWRGGWRSSNGRISGIFRPVRSQLTKSTAYYII